VVLSNFLVTRHSLALRPAPAGEGSLVYPENGS
jgi:hypothetical protein